MIRTCIRFLTRTILLVVLLVPLATLALPTPAVAATVFCENETFFNATIEGNLVVPDGARCDLDDTTVTGNVKVGEGAILDAFGGSINGNLLGDGFEFVGLGSDIEIGGNIVLTEGTSFFSISTGRVGGNIILVENDLDGPLVISNIEIGGNVTVEDNSVSNRFFIRANTVGGNLRFDDNTGSSEISTNTIGGSLRCKGNTPPPTGSGNTVSGRASGQCANL